MSPCLRLSSVLFMFALVSAASIDAQDKKGPPLATYYPMHVGNQWSFNVSVGDNATKATSRIAKIEKIEDVELVRLEAVVNGNVVATEHLRETDEGVFRYRNNGAEIIPPLKLLDYKEIAKLDKKTEKVTWGGKVKVGADQGTYTTEAKQEAIEVAAGKFQAIKVSIKLQQGPMQVNTSYWFVKDVGFVKQTVEAGGLLIVMDLEKFDKSKDATK